LEKRSSEREKKRPDMRMQEPQPQRQGGQEAQAKQDPDFASAAYAGSFDAEQPEYIEVVAQEDDRQQKIYPRTRHTGRGNIPGLVAIVLSSLGFCVAIAGIIVSAIVLRYGHAAMRVGGALGLAGSILGLLVCIAVFVISVIFLTLRARRLGRRFGSGV
jgi:hypothetical protein